MVAKGPPGYVRRFTRILQVLELLEDYPGTGRPLAEIAAELGVSIAELREEILAYYGVEPLMGEGANDFMPGIDFLSADGGVDDGDEVVTDIVVLTDPAALGHLGVARLQQADHARIWMAGRRLLDLEPDNEPLASALAQLEATRFGDVAVGGGEAGTQHLPTLRDAVDQRKAVRIRYMRDWRPGASSRTIHPYKLYYTVQGWELDAGPVDEHGNVRTFLLRNIEELTELMEPFDVPSGIESTMAANRAVLQVDVDLPQTANWGGDGLVESRALLRGDEDRATLRLAVRPPYASRVMLVLAPTHGGGRILEPSELLPQVQEHARRLLAHHKRRLP